MTDIERYSLAIGEHVAVLENRSYPPDAGMVASGEPLKIVEISRPFILVETPYQSFSLDARVFELVRVHRDYYRKFWGAARRNINRDVQSGIPLDRPKRKRRRRRLVSVKGDGQCPNCRAKFIQRLVSSGLWRYVCPKCGTDGGEFETPLEKPPKTGL